MSNPAPSAGQHALSELGVVQERQRPRHAHPDRGDGFARLAAQLRGRCRPAVLTVGGRIGPAAPGGLSACTQP